MTNAWQAWLGRGEDRVDAALLRRWRATFDHPAGPNDFVPQGFHWCLCTPEAPTATLGADGHPRNLDNPHSYLPPVPLPRRMWASSKVEFHQPLRPGQHVMRQTRVAGIAEKHGSSGTLVFVDVTHDTHGPDGLAVSETQTIVYRDAPPPGMQPPAATAGTAFDPAGWDAHRLIVPSERLLQRYSALTFNSHRIHYDLPYAVQQEGYRGLVVHGPLMATLLLDLAQRHFGENCVKRFAFRSLSPAICGEELHLALRNDKGLLELGAFAGDRRRVVMAMTGESAGRRLSAQAA